MAANVEMKEVYDPAMHVLSLLADEDAGPQRACEAARALVRLGAALEARLAEPAADAKTDHVSTGGILLADDNAANRALFREYLRRIGVEPIVAESGDAALERIAEGDICLAILDIDMPGTSGLEVAKRLRECAGCTDIRLVAVTGYSYPYADPEFAAFDTYLVKPISENELRKVVIDFLAER
jgi:CheY-like chemotaxis protein